MMPLLQIQPYTLTGADGPVLQSFGAPVSVMATWEQTGGVFNLFEVSCPPDYATPLHIHYAEDLAVYVLEGALTFFWGNEQREALAGSFFFQPRGTPHGFRVAGGIPARLLYLAVPAGLDRFVIEQERPSPNSEPATAAARYQIEIVGPLLE